MTVKYADMESKLLTLDQAYNRLAATEPLGAVSISGEDATQVKWRFEPQWAHTLDTTHGTSAVAATVEVDGQEHTLTKDAVLTAASAFGLPGTHAKALPANLLENEMNYWFGAGIGNQKFSLLTVGQDEVAAAFVKPTKTAFSNLNLLEAIVARIEKLMGADARVMVDYKFNHSLSKSDIRLIIPGMATVIDSSTQDDEWCGGVHLSNSLIGKSQTSVESYLFRWWCTNGATSQYGTSGAWNRRTDGQNEADVLAWAQQEVDSIFEGLPQRWSELQKLTQVGIEGNFEAIARDVFRTYGVPYTQQNEIISELGNTDSELTMYDLMQAITQLANGTSLRPERQDTLMRIGGAIPSALFDPLNKKLWDEGHSADPDAVNPYVA